MRTSTTAIATARAARETNRGAPNDSRLALFEDEVCLALRTGRQDRLKIVGSGEVTAVLALDDGWVCKRIPAWPSQADAKRCAAVIGDYIVALRAAGIDVIETDVRVVAADGKRYGRASASPHTWSVYCIQPRLDRGMLATERLRDARRDDVLRLYDRILTAIRRCVSPRLAPDGQVSNWAFAGERLLYLDVSSPFLRDAAGADRLDWAHYLRSLPAPVRPVARRWVVPHVLDKYFTLRGQVLDLIGNLRKERLDRWIEPFRCYANQTLGLEPAIDPDEVDSYYAADARTYAFLQAARRLDNAVHRLFGREYPYVLPPKIDRHR